jgi:hypothetical protein
MLALQPGAEAAEVDDDAAGVEQDGAEGGKMNYGMKTNTMLR